MKNYIASDMKDLNRKTVLKLIMSRKDISRIEISRLTGISAPTVLKITNYLMENDFIRGIGEGNTALGRKPLLLRFNPDAAFTIGVDYEGDYLKIGIVNIAGSIKAKKQIKVLAGMDEVIEKVIVKEVKALLIKANIPYSKVLGLGLGIPAAVNQETEEIWFAPLIGIDDGKSIKSSIDLMRSKLGIPVYTYNDVNAAALGEYVIRKLNNEDLLYISLGTGLGAGIILNGKIHSGKYFTAGEVGYMVFDNGCETSRSSPGWLESSINLGNLIKKFPEIADMDPNNCNAEELKHVAEYIAGRLSVCIANCVAVLGTGLIVLGGMVTNMLGDVLIDEIKRKHEKLCIIDTSIEKNKCAEPGITGTALMVLESEFDNLLRTIADTNQQEDYYSSEDLS